MNTPVATTPPAEPTIDIIALRAPIAGAPAAAAVRQQISAIIELTKPRITRLVTITAGVGFVMAAVGRETLPTAELIVAALGCLFGTACSAAGASALNQWIERRRDALMTRTQSRPLPQQRVTPGTAFIAGAGLCVLGVTTLLLTTGPAAALVSLSTILLYLLAYTPLKPVTTIATIVGAVPGALPPLIGWAAAGAAGSAEASSPFAPLLQAGGWSLFLLMFVWQIPHFLAIAWMYKDDYAKGGYKILPLVDPTGNRTACTILLWSLALIPATLSPGLAMSGRLGLGYAIVAAITGLGYLAMASRLARTHTRDNAKRVFVASIIHLPLLLVAMVADALLTAIL